MAKTLNDSCFVPIVVPNGLLKDQQACLINAIKIVFANINSTEIDIEILKQIFQYDEKGASYQRYHFQRFNNYLFMQRVPFRTNIDYFNDISETYNLLSSNIPVPIFFGMEVLKLIQKQIQDEYKFNVGENVFRDENSHILLFVGYKDNGENLLFVDPVYQLPYQEGNKIKDEKDVITLNFKDAHQHFKHFKSYINFNFDLERAKQFKKEEKQKKLG